MWRRGDASAGGHRPRTGPVGADAPLHPLVRPATPSRCLEFVRQGRHGDGRTPPICRPISW